MLSLTKQNQQLNGEFTMKNLKKTVMSLAWKIAGDIAFGAGKKAGKGGKAVDYIATGLKKAWAWVKEKAADNKAVADVKKTLFTLPTPTKETEKALAFDVYMANSAQSLIKTVWLPKSQVVNGQAKGWILMAKMKELLAANAHYRAWVESDFWGEFS